ncbi:MAG: excinuclease ABC subunit UvrC, partial [Actinobacteria bacterium]|nr:excinuclease ABC subunit UvrC [Actinomycetota bacterium]
RFTKRLEAEMRAAAAAEEFERAARLRDDIQALERALEKQAVVLGDGTDCDVIALAGDQLEAAVQVFYVRGGRVRGQRGWVVDKVEDVTDGDLVEDFLSQVYGDDAVASGLAAAGGTGNGPAAGNGPASANGPAGSNRPASANGQDTAPGRGRRGDSGDPLAPRRARRTGLAEASVPREVLVPVLPPDTEAVEEWLTARRGSRVRLRVPRRGDKKALLDTVARNAGESLALHKTRRASDLTTRSRALHEIQEALGLAEAPLRIECYDVSNLQQTHVVASMVVFEDGLARKSEYRRFRVKGTGGEGDVAAVREVITRRFRNYLEEREATGELDMLGEARDPEPGTVARQRKFAYPPNLAVIDGGPAQVAAAASALAELGVDDVAVCGLAKRLEEVWLPGEDSPVILPRTSEGLYLLQRVRDEAHRFAITYHRQQRSKALKTSELDEVPGLGPARRTTLLRHFGSVRRLAAASEQDIAAVPGIGPRLASAVAAALKAHAGGSGGVVPPGQQSAPVANGGQAGR